MLLWFQGNITSSWQYIELQRSHRVSNWEWYRKHCLGVCQGLGWNPTKIFIVLVVLEQATRFPAQHETVAGQAPPRCVSGWPSLPYPLLHTPLLPFPFIWYKLLWWWLLRCCGSWPSGTKFLEHIYYFHLKLCARTQIIQPVLKQDPKVKPDFLSFQALCLCRQLQKMPQD